MHTHLKMVNICTLIQPYKVLTHMHTKKRAQIFTIIFWQADRETDTLALLRTGQARKGWHRFGQDSKMKITSKMKMTSKIKTASKMKMTSKMKTTTKMKTSSKMFLSKFFHSYLYLYLLTICQDNGSLTLLRPNLISTLNFYKNNKFPF